MLCTLKEQMGTEEVKGQIEQVVWKSYLSSDFKVKIPKLTSEFGQ